MKKKGEIIGQEILGNSIQMKYVPLIMGIIIMILCGILIFLFIRIMIRGFDDISQMQKIYDISAWTFVFIIASGTLYFWGHSMMFRRALRRVRMKIYSNGIVPYRYPKGYKNLKGEDYFLSWNNLSSMTLLAEEPFTRHLFSGPTSEKFWCYELYFKDNTHVRVASRYRP